MTYEAKVVNIVTATAQLVEGRQITINGNFYEGESQFERNASLDAIMDVLERQRKRFEIPVMRKEMEARLAALKANMDAMESLSTDLQAKKGKGNVIQMRQTIDVHRRNIQKIQEDIKFGHEKLKELEDEVSQGVAA